MRAGLLSALLLVGCAGSSPAPSATRTQALASAEKAPRGSVADLALATFPGKGEHAFATDRGQVIVIDAWATWCAPCLRSLPLLQRFGKEYSGRGVRVYAVSVDEDRSQIPKFLAGAGVSLPVLLDPGGFVLEARLGLKQMPTTWVVDRAGQVRFTQESFDGNLDDVRAQVDSLLEDGQ